MPRTFAGFVLLLLAVLALLSPGKAVAGPPVGVSGKMVLDGKKVPTPAGVVLLRKTNLGMVAEGQGFRATSTRITWDKTQKELLMEGGGGTLAMLYQDVPGNELRVITAGDLVFSLISRKIYLRKKVIIGGQ